MSKLNLDKYTDFGDRLRIVIGDTTIKSFSTLSGLGTTTLQSYLNGTSYPTLDRLNSIAGAAKVDINWLLTGDDQVNTTCSNASKYIKIPHFDVHASAGAGFELVESGISKNTINIHSQTLLEHGLSPKNLLSMYVKGDSMEPSLFDGDTVLIKKVSQRFSILEGVYIFRVHNEIFIKRIQFNKYDATMQVDSDNPLYRTYTIRNGDLNDVEIIGEVICTIFSKVRRICRPVGEAIAMDAN